MVPVAMAPGASEFGERQADDFRRQGQPDIAWVDDKPLSCLVAEVFLEGPNPICHPRTRRRGKLDLYRNQFAADLDDQIDFHSCRSAPEVYLRLLAAVDEGFHDAPPSKSMERRRKSTMKLA